MSETKFESHNPATGAVIGTYPINTVEEVNAAVTTAREAATWWAGLEPRERKRRLLAWVGEMARRQEELVELIVAENGKPRDDAFLEVALALEHLHWAATHAKRALRRRRVNPGLLASNHAAYLEWRPYGVVGVIGPWNYPVFTPFGSIAYALAAGNTVVYKPSEYTPGIGLWYVDAFSSANPDAPPGVLTAVTGLGETGAALCRSGVDKLAFTGSPGTGRKVAAVCAESLTPVLMECGGKDAAIVADDADLEAAADAILWGGLANSGQTCTGVERVYVTRAVRDDFLNHLRAKAERIKPGHTYGPMTMPSQINIVRKHIEDALAGGGTALVGGPDSVGETMIAPVIIVDAPEDSSAVQEETFGPTLTVTTVENTDEAIRLANSTPYGLGSGVYSKKNGMAIAQKIRSGATSVNSPLAYAFVPALPFGGEGESGYGRIHGPLGLQEFAQPKALTRQMFPAPIALATLFRDPKKVDLVRKVTNLRFGRYR